MPAIAGRCGGRSSMKTAQLLEEYSRPEVAYNQYALHVGA